MTTSASPFFSASINIRHCGVFLCKMSTWHTHTRPGTQGATDAVPDLTDFLKHPRQPGGLLAISWCLGADKSAQGEVRQVGRLSMSLRRSHKNCITNTRLWDEAEVGTWYREDETATWYREAEAAGRIRHTVYFISSHLLLHLAFFRHQCVALRQVSVWCRHIADDQLSYFYIKKG